jgi:hypothetical protein
MLKFQIQTIFSKVIKIKVVQVHLPSIKNLRITFSGWDDILSTF